MHQLFFEINSGEQVARPCVPDSSPEILFFNPCFFWLESAAKVAGPLLDFRSSPFFNFILGSPFQGLTQTMFSEMMLMVFMASFCYKAMGNKSTKGHAPTEQEGGVRLFRLSLRQKLLHAVVNVGVKSICLFPTANACQLLHGF